MTMNDTKMSKSNLNGGDNADTKETEPSAAAGPSKDTNRKISISPEPKSVLSSTNETVDVGGSVPLLIKPQLLDPIMCRQTVGPRCRLGLKFRVTAPDQELRWRFRTLKGKMSFAVYRQQLKSTAAAKEQEELSVCSAEDDNEKTNTNGQENVSLELLTMMSDMIPLNESHLEPESQLDKLTIDRSSTLEIVRAPEVWHATKEYTSDRLSCVEGYDYLVVIKNKNLMLQSLSVIHMVQLLPKNAASPPYEMFAKHDCAVSKVDLKISREILENSDALVPKMHLKKMAAASPEEQTERAAKIEDLMNFVTEITSSESFAAERAKASKSKSSVPLFSKTGSINSPSSKKIMEHQKQASSSAAANNADIHQPC